jgi:hypothetical protein
MAGEGEKNMTYYEREEANSKIGKKIRTLHEFSGVPEGTTGTVLNAYKVTEYPPKNRYGLTIQWDLLNLDGIYQPILDGFSKDEYEQFLQET